MDFTGVFTYNSAYLATEPQNLAIVFVVAILFLIATIFARFLSLVFAGLLLLRKDRKMIETRKNTLADLVMMKDIQTELEKEIEQATLKAAFQN